MCDRQIFIPSLDPLSEMKSSWAHSWRLNLEEPTSHATRISSYTELHILPTLLPGLTALSSAIESNGGHEISPPNPLDDIKTQSVELKVFFAKNLNQILARGLEHTYKLSPSDPLDCLASFLFKNSADEHLSPEFDDQLDPLVFLAQFLMRNNPKFAPPPHHQCQVRRTRAPTRLTSRLSFPPTPH